MLSSLTPRDCVRSVFASALAEQPTKESFPRPFGDGARSEYGLKRGEVLANFRGARMIRPEALFPNRERAAKQRLRLAEQIVALSNSARLLRYVATSG